MQLSTAVRPISAVKAHLTEIIRTFSEEAAPPVVITQNGEAKAVLMGIHEYTRMQNPLALLKALSLSSKSFEAGNGRSAGEVFADLRAIEERGPFPLGRTPVSLARLGGEQGLYIYTCTAANAGQAQADTILGKLEQTTLALESFPLCGNVPSELEIVGITRYREIHTIHGAEYTKCLKPLCMSIGFSILNAMGQAVCAKDIAGITHATGHPGRSGA